MSTAPPTDQGGILALGVRRPIGMLMVVLAVCVFGAVSLTRLPLDLLPEVDHPSLVVRTIYPGAAPQDTEERVTERLEDALATVPGLLRMRSSSRAESSEITLEFQWGSNLPFLVQDVRERIDRVFLPQGVERPLILRYDPSLDPILRVAVSGGEDLVRLRDFVERELERELEGLPGVAAVKVQGGLEDEIQVRLDPQLLAAYRLTSQVVLRRLQEENLNVPGGTIEEGSVEYVVRTLNEFRNLEEIEDLPIVLRGDRFLKLQDLGTVARTHKDRDVILRVDGREAVEVDIYREADANIVETAQRVKDRLFGSKTQQQYWSSPRHRAIAEAKAKDRVALLRQQMGDFLARRLPSDWKVTLLSDQARFVDAAIKEVRSAGLLGGSLAVLVCFLFLRRLPPTFVVGISIPISVIATFGPMYLGGVTLNIMSLGGLALGIGMLVDNTIVVLESITRCREEGDPPLVAAVRGVSEVGGAVTASTLTTVAVFAPIVFVEGVAGQTFKDQAVTVVASLAISLAVALYFIPGLAARIDRSGQPGMAAAPSRRFRWPRISWPRTFRSRLVTVGLLVLGLALAGMAMPTLSEHGGYEKIPRAQRVAVDWMLMGAGGSLLLAFWWLLEWVAVLVGSLMLWLLVRLASLLWRGPGMLRYLGVLLRPIQWVVDKVLGAIQGLYPIVLRRSLQAPTLVLIVTAGLAWLAWDSLGSLGRELLPEVKQGELTAELIFPAGSPLSATDRLASRMEQRLRDVDGVLEAAVLSGADRESVSADEEGPHTARILIRTRRGPDALETEMAVEQEIRAILGKEPAIARFQIRRPTLLALKQPLEIEILSEDLEIMASVAREVQETLRDLPGVVDLRSSLRRGNPEVLVTLDRERLAEHGLELGQVADRLRIAVEGQVPTTFPSGDQRVDIRVRADLSNLQNVEQLRDLPVNPEAERPIPLGAVASFRIADGPSEIRHVGGRRAAVLTATTAGFDLGAVTDRVEERLAEVPRPASVLMQVGGQKAEMDASLRSLTFALCLAVFLVYAVMAAQFESLIQPLLIMLSVPLAAVGAVFAMRLLDTPVSVVALLGAVVLAGIVVNNAIVLVDRINRNRHQKGMELDEAIVEAGRARLRPILMTTVTTVLGMLPLTGWLKGLPLIGQIGAAEGTELRAPMALVVIAGLLSSTILTLVVIPTAYRLMARLTERRAAHG